MAVKKNATTDTKDVKTEVKETAPKTEKAAKTTKTTKAAKTAPKTAAKTAKKPAAEPVVIIEYADKNVNIDTVVNDCKAHYKSLGHNTPKNLAVYVKPEEGVAYYTVNGKGSDENKVNL